MRDALVAIHPQCTTNVAIEVWCRAVICLTHPTELWILDLFGTAAVRDAMIAMSHHATSDSAVEAWCSATMNLNVTDANQVVFRTPSFRDALISLRSFATYTKATEVWCTAVSNITYQSPTNKILGSDNVNMLFGTDSVRDAFVAIQPQCTSQTAFERWCLGVSNITYKSSYRNLTLFGTESMRDALVAIRSKCWTAAAVKWWCRSVLNITHKSPHNITLFGTEGIRDALVQLSEVLVLSRTNVKDARVWCELLRNITSAVYSNDGDVGGNQVLFRSTGVRDALVAMQPLAMSEGGFECVSAWCGAVCNITTLHESNAGLEGVFDAPCFLQTMSNMGI